MGKKKIEKLETSLKPRVDIQEKIVERIYHEVKEKEITAGYEVNFDTEILKPEAQVVTYFVKHSLFNFPFDTFEGQILIVKNLSGGNLHLSVKEHIDIIANNDTFLCQYTSGNWVRLGVSMNKIHEKNTIYVDCSYGSDIDGTFEDPNHPFGTLTKALERISKLIDTTLIIIRPGIYTENVIIKNAILRGSKNTILSSDLTFLSDASVVIDCQIQGTLTISTKVKFKDCVFKEKGKSCFVFKSGANVEFDNCRIISESGILLIEPVCLTFNRCSIEHSGPAFLSEFGSSKSKIDFLYSNINYVPSETNNEKVFLNIENFDGKICHNVFNIVAPSEQKDKYKICKDQNFKSEAFNYFENSMNQ